MNRKNFNSLVLKCLGKNKKKDIKNLSWDSLGHLTILAELEKKIPNKITSIKQISEATTYKKLYKTFWEYKKVKGATVRATCCKPVSYDRQINRRNYILLMISHD